MLRRAWLWIAALLVLGLGAGCGSGDAVDPSPEEIARQEAIVASMAASAEATAEPTMPTLAPDATSILVIGDSYSQSAGATTKKEGYAYKAAAILGWALVVDAQGGTGYTAGANNPAKAPYPARVPAAVSGQFDVILVEGSINDSEADADAIQAAAIATFDAIRIASPTSRIVALGPSWPPSRTAESVTKVRDAVAAAAQATGVEFIDSLTWLDTNDSTLWVSDRSHPSQAGHDSIARQLASALALPPAPQ